LSGARSTVDRAASDAHARERDRVAWNLPRAVTISPVVSAKKVLEAGNEPVGAVEETGTDG